ncbi:phosphoadenylyl-sulfate reductase [Pontibacter qinzhouensis]|uniref:Adenosine 5'-phosphosulfate reductase n=1 Tax=Pontibacter qinzhouensis TaxID=2603253 RepID=A0A5C8JIA6_9BACT|nr:phosphoadenylyl-sulfate reductase [Pontibacter qinzhouensis]TXK36723.1 phosphoadenylyl-sulfate reductase [Pontibacter qinzhouensis]
MSQTEALTIQVPELESAIASKSIVESLQYLAEKFPGQIAFSSSLGIEDQVVTHLILANNIPIRVFTLDTGRLFNETYNLLHNTNKRYKTKIEVYFPNTASVEKLVNEKGPNSFYQSVENRKECCYIRKVEPLNRALQGVKCWVTGIRREQSDARQTLKALEYDEKLQLVKYNPLLEWSFEETTQYAKDNYVLYNPLHDQGFVSIGCASCTRAIQPGEHFRAGRWWWEDNSKKECGLHTH